MAGWLADWLASFACWLATGYLTRVRSVPLDSSTVVGARTLLLVEPSEGSGSVAELHPSFSALCHYSEDHGYARDCPPRSRSHDDRETLGDDPASCGACSLVRSPEECYRARCRRRTDTQILPSAPGRDPTFGTALTVSRRI
uniref:Putative secreted protein n=1 Tax=Anopheles triannulatus TaxID=58253 RepID=A0A2M4B1S6_9DIPT